MKSDRLLLLTFAILLGIMIVSCSKEERTVLTTNERKLVDSLYSKGISYVRKRTDSLCEIRGEEYFDYYVDSLKIAYIQSVSEIEEYLYNKDE